ncbi:DUF4142 domain-containing protein [Streptosporangium sp. CA-135522]|uniref:DUF4142 domain-containing protein n=1 Tax=Streptosporangium sp. CA-135522 TaxID=3240072 RepID=UPI003D927284
MALRTPLAAIAATSAAVLALMSGSPAALAQPTPTPMPTSSGAQQVPEQDSRYLMQAHRSNLAEIAAGKLAEGKTRAGDVRSIAETLVSDHTKLDKKLQQVAQRLNVTLPTDPSARQQAKAKELSGLSGAEFDKAWVKAMINGHRAALIATKREISNGSVPQVKALARSAEPIIQGHLDKLLAVQKSLGALGPVQPRTVQVAVVPQAVTN